MKQTLWVIPSTDYAEQLFPAGDLDDLCKQQKEITAGGPVYAIPGEVWQINTKDNEGITGSYADPGCLLHFRLYDPLWDALPGQTKNYIVAGSDPYTQTSHVSAGCIFTHKPTILTRADIAGQITSETAAITNPILYARTTRGTGHAGSYTVPAGMNITSATYVYLIIMLTSTINLSGVTQNTSYNELYYGTKAACTAAMGTYVTLASPGTIVANSISGGTKALVSNASSFTTASIAQGETVRYALYAVDATNGYFQFFPGSFYAAQTNFVALDADDNTVTSPVALADTFHLYHNAGVIDRLNVLKKGRNTAQLAVGGKPWAMNYMYKRDRLGITGKMWRGWGLSYLDEGDIW